MKVLSVSKVSSDDRWCRELCVGPKPVAMGSQKVRVFGSSTPVHDALGLGFSIICLRCSAYMNLIRWDLHAHQLQQMGADVSGFWAFQSHSKSILLMCKLMLLHWLP